ncbi:Ribosome production factor 2-like [Porphyridium purpureum]|uniref:Ribosome production factor 2 homolog n=1 Tax=Porphyridium purpureum TaxID=35688 RepID=A0A5J4Z1F5_PORPP|nr:Ribosome production factor 2-like [Porphyridium purpureum]|eukprot:POR3488..scf208_2
MGKRVEPSKKRAPAVRSKAGKLGKTGQNATKRVTRKGKRVLQERAGKHKENAKKVLVLKGRSGSEVINNVLRELQLLKAPLCCRLQRKNDILPFESGKDGLLESLARKYDCSLFAMGSHSKKRPHNLVLGRMFDFSVLDMVEFGVEQLKGIHAFGGAAKFAPGTKPMIVFNGDDYERSQLTAKIKNLLLDFLRGEEMEALDLTGLDRVIVCTLLPEEQQAGLDQPQSPSAVVAINQFRVELLKNPDAPKVPKSRLVDAGPSMILRARRSQFASDELYRSALRRSKENKQKSKKNISHDVFGDELGRIHLGKQDLGQLVTARPKALKKSRSDGEGSNGYVQNANEEDSEMDGGSQLEFEDDSADDGQDGSLDSNSDSDADSS